MDLQALLIAPLRQVQVWILMMTVGGFTGTTFVSDTEQLLFQIDKNDRCELFQTCSFFSCVQTYFWSQTTC